MSTAPDEFTVWVHRLVEDLRRAANQVEELGLTERRDDNGNVSRTDAVYAIDGVMANIPNTRHLWWVAIQMDHPTARLTPAQLLDRAATGLTENGYPGDVTDPVTVAEAALRGAGVIR